MTITVDLTRRRRVRRIRSTILIIIATFIAGMYVLIANGIDFVKKHDVERLLASGGIASGTRYETVISFLRAHHMTPSQYYENTRSVNVMIPNAAFHFPVVTSISIIFYFDTDRRLSRYQISEVYTGL